MYKGTFLRQKSVVAQNCLGLNNPSIIHMEYYIDRNNSNLTGLYNFCEYNCYESVQEVYSLCALKQV